MKAFDPKPEVLRIEELVLKVKTGDIKLPKFQRPFVWKKKDILSLLDSIYKGYPIGSILLWFTKEKLASERNIGDFKIDDRSLEYPTNYLLDGQQRLSTLCGALFWNGSDLKSMWNIAFDLEKEVFIHPESNSKPEYLPLNKVIGTMDFINECRKIEALPNKDKYIKNAERLLQAIKDYKVAAVTIGDMTVHEVAPIFERINSTGRRLTIVDLMRAATWSGDFDLSDTIQKIREVLKPKNFEDVSEADILKNISSVMGYGINKDDMDKLRDCTSSELKNAALKCVEAYKHAVDFLTSELPITSSSYLPYGLQLTLLVEFFNICPSPTVQQRDELKKWFWRTAFSRYFASFNTAQLTKDLEEIRSFANGNTTTLNFSTPIDFKKFVFDDFKLNKANSKSLGLLLASKKPQSLLDGSVINIANVLAVINRHEYHHIFPKAYLKNTNISDKEANYHSNICLLNLINNRTISDKKPSIYFNTVLDSLGDSAADILESNFISQKALDAALVDDYSKFLELRSEDLIKQMKLLCE
ncbi:DUF262 domain-containing protein [Lysinibacillus louembei]|uniref:DUF262 domain-containing protein n=1 Tax=Lysinibacillus louembei TaxID=1470088 RepID=A0ABZ0RV75_9BACI|nr:DUF262 domain-containing protein [Lysinibacillus louembei]WPK10745.1 DUF262 domain-containing protein [Lysinibacillus louembei]